MSKTLYSVSEFFCIAPENMRAEVCTSEDNDRFVIFYDKDDETNGIFSLPLMFGNKIKDGNVNPSFLNIVKLNDKYVVTVNDIIIRLKVTLRHVLTNISSSLK